MIAFGQPLETNPIRVVQGHPLATVCVARVRAIVYAPRRRTGSTMEIDGLP